MANHLSRVDDASAVEYAAILEAFEWALDVMGILPEERASLVRSAARPGLRRSRSDAAVETMVRRLVDIATDLQAMLGDEDEIREWLRSVNPGLWTTSPVPVRTSPLRVMLDHEDGIRAIRDQLADERRRRCCPAWCR